ncbi:MAG: hypothetical protein JWQ89_2145 [Devosia sp.]|uniref:DUF7662 domain-containing protein n=1 Tax=Devosia sp. TaxID=1871048 RepID=UPI002638E945|nr:hypothetical protein [Devosia sp.]MDB5540418.1 hypothetical protein [Devosia sp.]
MSKYDGLFRHLSRSTGTIEVTFEDVEEILGFPLPVSARRYAAWWSNSGGTHVQAGAWMAAGYRTENVDVGLGKVRFVPGEVAEGFGEMKQATFKLEDSDTADDGKEKKPYRHPAWGALKGMITILPGVDLTEPAFDDWKALYGEEE